MPRILRWSGLVLILACALPVLLADDKKPDPAKAAKDPKEAAEKMVAAGELDGRVVTVEGTNKVVKIEVAVHYTEVNQGAVQGLAQARVHLLQAQANRDVAGMRNAQVEMARNEANLYQMKEMKKTVDVGFNEDTKVRLKDPPVTFDEKGRVKKYTPAELKELKGDPKLPGYAGDFDSLHPDQIVQVKLVKKKEAPHKPKEEDKDALTDAQLTAGTIMILAEPMPK